PRTRMKMNGMANRMMPARGSRSSRRHSFFAIVQMAMVVVPTAECMSPGEPDSIAQRVSGEVQEHPFQIGLFRFQADQLQLELVEHGYELQQGFLDFSTFQFQPLS